MFDGCRPKWFQDRTRRKPPGLSGEFWIPLDLNLSKHRTYTPFEEPRQDLFQPGMKNLFVDSRVAASFGSHGSLERLFLEVLEDGTPIGVKTRVSRLTPSSNHMRSGSLTRVSLLPGDIWVSLNEWLPIKGQPPRGPSQLLTMRL